MISYWKSVSNQQNGAPMNYFYVTREDGKDGYNIYINCATKTPEMHVHGLSKVFPTSYFIERSSNYTPITRQELLDSSADLMK